METEAHLIFWAFSLKEVKSFRSHGNRLNTELTYCYSNHRKSINRQVHHTQCHDEHIQSKSFYFKPHVGFFFFSMAGV